MKGRSEFLEKGEHCACGAVLPWHLFELALGRLTHHCASLLAAEQVGCGRVYESDSLGRVKLVKDRKPTL